MGLIPSTEQEKAALELSLNGLTTRSDGSYRNIGSIVTCTESKYQEEIIDYTAEKHSSTMACHTAIDLTVCMAIVIYVPIK